jgi:ribosomal protein S18 acetylase RimI-like enzyme
MQIRQLIRKDLDDVLLLASEEPEFRIGSNVFWTERQLERWIDSESDVCLGAFLGEKLAGFVLVAVHVPTGKATVENVYVDPRWRHQGIADSLIEEACRILRERGVTCATAFVRKDNGRSCVLFRSAMFIDCGVFHWYIRIPAADRRARR